MFQEELYLVPLSKKNWKFSAQSPYISSYWHFVIQLEKLMFKKMFLRFPECNVLENFVKVREADDSYFVEPWNLNQDTYFIKWKVWIVYK